MAGTPLTTYQSSCHEQFHYIAPGVLVQGAAV